MNKLNTLLKLVMILICFSCFEDTSRMMVDGTLEPPAPNSSENDKTIGGIDSNEDGVRDDIERWINREFHGEENYNKRMAWKQEAKAIRDVQLSATTKEKALRSLYHWNSVGLCTFYIYSTLNKERLKEKFRIGDALLEMSNDTEERFKRWMFADRSAVGKAFTDPGSGEGHKRCGFDIRK